MTCKNCGAELQAADTFCGECGVKIESQEKEAEKCNDCGKFFNKEFGMCPFCGTELAEDNIELTDNQHIPLSVTDTEEAFVEENTEGNLVLCPNCNNKYDINVGLCTICGYSSLELDEFGIEDEDALNNGVANEENTSDKLQNAYNSAYCDTEENKPVNYKKIGIISAVVIGFIIVIALIVNGGKLSGVSINQIESDISELSVVTNGVIESEYTPFTPYTVNSVEIEKRQTNIDDKEDIVYCNVVISNEYYQTDLQIKLVYDYYDDGGWVLEENEITSNNSVPIKGIELKDCNIAYYDEDFSFIDTKPNNYVITQETDIENQIDYLYISDEQNNYKISASVVFSFDQYVGWQTSNSNDDKEICPVIDSVKFDYESVIKGTFETSGEFKAFGFNFPYERRLKITSYNNETGEIKGNYYSYNDYSSERITADNFNAVLNKENNSITFSATRKYYGTSDTYVTLDYNFDKDVWYCNGKIIERN